MLPLPLEAMLSLPGSALAQAINSGMVLAGADGLTTHYERVAADARDRCKIANETEFLVVHRLDQISRNKGMSVRRGVYNRFDADPGASTRLVVDYKWLAKAVC